MRRDTHYFAHEKELMQISKFIILSNEIVNDFQSLFTDIIIDQVTNDTRDICANGNKV